MNQSSGTPKGSSPQSMVELVFRVIVGVLFSLLCIVQTIALGSVNENRIMTAMIRAGIYGYIAWKSFKGIQWGTSHRRDK